MLIMVLLLVFALDLRLKGSKTQKTHRSTRTQQGFVGAVRLKLCSSRGAQAKESMIRSRTGGTGGGDRGSRGRGDALS